MWATVVCIGGIAPAVSHRPSRLSGTDHGEWIGEPNIPIRAGEAQFWQIGNIGANRFLRVKIDGMPLYLMGRDAYFVPRPIRMEEALLALSIGEPHHDLAVAVLCRVGSRYHYTSRAAN